MKSGRFLIQVGMGVDQHGQDMTTAAVRAVRDAIATNCLTGLREVVGLKSPREMIVEVTIAAPYPDRIDLEEVKKVLPFGELHISTEKGGMIVHGIVQPELGDTNDEFLVANASVIVKVTLPQ